MRMLPEADRIAQHIVDCSFLAPYRTIKQSKNPRVAAAQALMGINQMRLVGFIIKLLEDWCLQNRQLDSANHILGSKPARSAP